MGAQASEEYDWWFRAAYASVSRTVFLILHDRASAEEVAQDAFVQLYRHWSTVRGYERPDLWVRRVAIRLAVRRVKRDRMRSERDRLAASEPPERSPDLDVIRAVATLSPMQRDTEDRHEVKHGRRRPHSARSPPRTRRAHAAADAVQRLVSRTEGSSLDRVKGSHRARPWKAASSAALMDLGAGSPAVSGRCPEGVRASTGPGHG